MADGEGNGKEAYSKWKSNGIWHFQREWHWEYEGFYLTVLIQHIVQWYVYHRDLIHIGGQWRWPGYLLTEEPLLLGLHTITTSSSGFPDDQNVLVPLWFFLVENTVWQHEANRWISSEFHSPLPKTLIVWEWTWKWDVLASRPGSSIYESCDSD